MHKELEITRDTVIDDEKVLLSYKDTVVFSSNNVSVINGAKGSMKSTARDYLINNLLSPEENFVSRLDGSILVIDTEMSKRLIKQNLDRFNSDRVRFYSLKGVAITQVAKVTEDLIESLKPEVLCIDGSRDYLLNSNDPTESMKLINQLMYWAQQYKLHILNIVHSVSTDNGTKTKGTFGSELDNKAETIMSMQKKYDKSSLSCKFSRESLPFKPFSITLDENNIPKMIKDGR